MLTCHFMWTVPRTSTISGTATRVSAHLRPLPSQRTPPIRERSSRSAMASRASLESLNLKSTATVFATLVSSTTLEPSTSAHPWKIASLGSRISSRTSLSLLVSCCSFLHSSPSCHTSTLIPSALAVIAAELRKMIKRSELIKLWNTEKEQSICIHIKRYV